MSAGIPEPRCSLCKATFNAGAIKCVKCGGYQGRWFFLNLGVPTIGMLVALISVVSLSITVLTPIFRQDESDLRVSFQYFEEDVAHFVATNGGTRPGTIGEAWLDYKGNGSPERHYLVESTKNRFVPPGASRQLSFRIPCEETYPNIHYQRSEEFGAHPLRPMELVVTTVQFDGQKEAERFSVDELPGVSAMSDRAHRCLQEALRARINEDARRPLPSPAAPTAQPAPPPAPDTPG